MTNDELKAAITARAQALIKDWQRPIILQMDITHAVGLIGTVQLALRHPAAQQSPTMKMTENLTIDLIEKIDPEHGDVWKFLNMGFNRTFDE